MKNLIISLSIVTFLLILSFVFNSSFNTMIKYEEQSNKCWSQVQNVYQRRSDLIPNLVTIVQATASYEKTTLTNITEARAKATSIVINPGNATVEQLTAYSLAQSQIGLNISKLMVTIEKYPDLKSNKSFLMLQAQLEGTENRIEIERTKFNEAVKTYNQYLRVFPNNFYASMFNFKKKEYFSADDKSDKAPEIKLK